MLHQVTTAATSLLWLAAIFYPLEWALPARPEQRRMRPGWWADLAFFFGQHLLFVALVASVLSALARRIPDAWLLFDGLSLWPRALLAILLGDFCMYWGHRLQHRWEPLWRVHAVHHTTTHLDWLAAHREHPLDGLYTQLLVNLPAIFLGLHLDALLGLVAFRSLWAIFIHANVRVPLGPLRMLLGSPELHRWHHARDRDAGHYANLAPYLDWLFGTFHAPSGEPRALGIAEAHLTTYLGLLWFPFRRDEPAAPRTSPAEHAHTRRVTSTCPRPKGARRRINARVIGGQRSRVL